ncbi:MAG TPA: hypothetical protein VNE63_05255 [Candidatus Acidoferrales bacterium]|nr:hypothetical protein [Candidatus Acidoferrales bacterium]
MSKSDLTMQVNTEADTWQLPAGDAAGAARTRGAVEWDSRSAATRLLRWAFSFPAMLASLLVGAVFAAGRTFHVDPDLWWHIKAGETILATHHWPTTDPYSFTVAGQPWLAYEWLGEVLLGAVSRVGGVLGLDLLLIVLGSAIVLALYAFATLRTGNSKAGFVASALLLVLATASFTLRPQMLGYLFLILTLIALERFRQGKHGAIWFLPVLMLAWVNTHGSWIIGMGTIFVYWMSGLAEFQIGGIEAKKWTPAERRSISCVFLLSLLALPITPYGARIAASPFEFAFSLPLNVKYIEEWQSMSFSLLGGQIFLALLLGIILAQVMFRFTWRVEEFALFLFGTMMACMHVRFLLIFVPFFAPLLASIVSRWMPAYNRAKDKFALNAAIMACVAVALIHYFPSHTELQQSVAKQFPVAAVQYLNSHAVPEPMFNNYGFGGYLVWTRGPEHKVFIDGRGDVYERGGVLSDYLHISHLKPGALDVLRGYGVQSCLIERDEPLATLLSASPDWKRIHADDVSALFVRRKP